MYAGPPVVYVDALPSHAIHACTGCTRALGVWERVFPGMHKCNSIKHVTPMIVDDGANIAEGGGYGYADTLAPFLLHGLSRYFHHTLHSITHAHTRPVS